MKVIKNSGFMPVSAATAYLAIGLAIQGSQVQAEYLTTSSGEVVKTGSAECWSAAGGLAKPVEACGDVIEMAAVEELDHDGDGVPDSLDKCPETSDGVRVDAKGCPQDTDGDGVADYLDNCPRTPAGSKVNAEGCQIIENLVVKVTADHFKIDSAKLEPGMLKVLDELIVKVNSSSGHERLQIVGHTDGTGPESYNQGLSERRAQSVADYLIRQGFSRDNLSVSGMGESQPVANNDTREGRIKNRRVEILSR